MFLQFANLLYAAPTIKPGDVITTRNGDQYEVIKWTTDPYHISGVHDYAPHDVLYVQAWDNDYDSICADHIHPHDVLAVQHA